MFCKVNMKRLTLLTLMVVLTTATELNFRRLYHFEDGQNVTEEENNEVGDIVHFRMPRQTPGWQKFNQAMIDIVNKTSNAVPAIPFVVNVMCDDCIERMGKLPCCFFITWFCCRNGTIPGPE
ncbi:hypothetical protein CHUAL_008491 [Chamberlinius hualienensis]